MFEKKKGFQCISFKMICRDVEWLPMTSHMDPGDTMFIARQLSNEKKKRIIVRIFLMELMFMQ